MPVVLMQTCQVIGPQQELAHSAPILQLPDTKAAMLK